MKLRLSPWWAVIPMLAALGILADRRPPHPPHSAEWLDAGGVPVRVVRAGSGDTTLLLVHGYGESLTTWRAVFDRLASRMRVVAIDLPGFGLSGKPDAPYTLPAMTERLSSFLDQWTTGPVLVAGHSMGGAIAASLALARPDRVKALILIAPAGYRIGLAGIADTMYPSKARTIGRYLALRAFVTPIHDPTWLAEPDSTANYDLLGDSAYSRSAARVLEDFDWRGLHDRFDEIRQPTLLIWGGNDPVVPFSVGDTLSRIIPCVRFAPLPKAFHRPQAEVPDTVLGIIVPFLSDLRIRGSGDLGGRGPGEPGSRGAGDLGIRSACPLIP